jgi:hypothetical protein
MVQPGHCDRVNAEAHLKQCVATGKNNFTEYRLATAELKRMAAN